MTFKGATRLPTRLPSEDLDSQAFELTPDDRQITLVLDGNESSASAERK
jgi:hypothetical protein